MAISERTVFFKVFFCLSIILNVLIIAFNLIFTYFPSLYNDLLLKYPFLDTIFFITTANDNKLMYPKITMSLTLIALFALLMLWKLRKLGFWIYTLIKISNVALIFITVDMFFAFNLFKLYLPITIFFIVPFLFYYRKLR